MWFCYPSVEKHGFIHSTKIQVRIDWVEYSNLCKWFNINLRKKTDFSATSTMSFLFIRMHRTKNQTWLSLWVGFMGRSHQFLCRIYLAEIKQRFSRKGTQNHRHHLSLRLIIFFPPVQRKRPLMSSFSSRTAIFHQSDFWFFLIMKLIVFFPRAPSKHDWTLCDLATPDMPVTWQLLICDLSNFNMTPKKVLLKIISKKT